LKKIAPGPEGGRPRGYLDYGIKDGACQAICKKINHKNLKK
jgi:hypothetical protein